QTLLTVNSAIQTVPIGIILSMQPSINLDTNEITLNVRPTLSSIVNFVSDPATAFLVAQAKAQGSNIDISNQVPIVQVRELDSILKLKSGQVMVIGGLMEDKSVNTDSGIPYAMDVPVLGNLFRGVNRTNNTQELVIFIRATIVDTNGDAQPADKAVYEKFTNDPRPLNF
ncbi:MAG: type II and III secretion system protein, partial [Alphaproteobacteria bacterium]|nr:type II and III secretion system protein [Alphaproteobacteria bacterium]